MRTKILLFLASVLIMAIPAYAKREPGSKVGAEFPELVFDFGTVNTKSGPVHHLSLIHI